MPQVLHPHRPRRGQKRSVDLGPRLQTLIGSRPSSPAPIASCPNPGPLTNPDRPRVEYEGGIRRIAGLGCTTFTATGNPSLVLHDGKLFTHMFAIATRPALNQRPKQHMVHESPVLTELVMTPSATWPWGSLPTPLAIPSRSPRKPIRLYCLNLSARANHSTLERTMAPMADLIKKPTWPIMHGNGNMLISRIGAYSPLPLPKYQRHSVSSA
jgi:hypothetical protein